MSKALDDISDLCANQLLAQEELHNDFVKNLKESYEYEITLHKSTLNGYKDLNEILQDNLHELRCDCRELVEQLESLTIQRDNLLDILSLPKQPVPEPITFQPAPFWLTDPTCVWYGDLSGPVPSENWTIKCSTGVDTPIGSFMNSVE